MQRVYGVNLQEIVHAVFIGVLLPPRDKTRHLFIFDPPFGGLEWEKNENSPRAYALCAHCVRTATALRHLLQRFWESNLWVIFPFNSLEIKAKPPQKCPFL